MTDLAGIPPEAFRTVAIDFDGVLHAYTRGFHDGTCYDPPMPGAIPALDELMAQRPVAVVTARPVLMVAEWFAVHDPTRPLFVDAWYHQSWWADRTKLLITNRKVVAEHYIDDRAIRFGQGRRGMAADWSDGLLVISHWDAIYAERHAAREEGTTP